jgi:SAM-dependent methyltransferase
VDAALLETLRCPFDRSDLELDRADLRCVACGREFAVEDGVPLLLHDDLPGAREKRREAAGWVEKARAEGWYEPNDAVDAVLPYVNWELGWDDQGWLATAHSFRVLLDRYVRGRSGLRVLEVGAAKGWAAPHWRERGCEYWATDVLIDPKIGLGRGVFYGDFPRVQADGEHLPFADASFDVVYCVATLHHALDLPRMVREMARVARRAGVVAGLNEGTRGMCAGGEAPDQSGERALGINEHVHTVWAYVAAFTRAGILIRRMERSDGYPPVGLGAAFARLPKVGTTLGTVVHLSSGAYAGASVYGRKVL